MLNKKKSLAGKIILYLLILTAIFFGLSALCSWSARTNRNYAVLKRDIVYLNLQDLKENSIDVLVLGDSETYSAISPLQLWEGTGITAYIAGQPGQRPAQMYSILQETLKKQKPKLVLLETDGLGKSDFQEAISQRLAYFIPVLRTHNEWKELFTSYHRKDVNYKGFRIRRTMAGYTGSVDYMDKRGKDRTLNDVDEHYVGLIKKTCEKIGAKMMLISIPSPRNYNKTRLKNLQKFADRMGLDYLDMNQYTQQMGLDWNTDTSDKGDHLNILGAQKVTAWMEENFFTSQGLTDHRDDPAYADWDQEAEEYDSAAASAIRQMKSGAEPAADEDGEG